MSLYWIGYDLDKPGQNYEDLISRLEELGAVRVLKSDWLFGHNQTTPEQIRNDLTRFTDKNDRMLVAELHNNAAWNNLMASNETVLDLFKRFAR